MAIVFVAQKHWQAYMQAEATREKMAHNLSLDIVGLLLGMAAAIFAGGRAGWQGSGQGWGPDSRLVFFGGTCPERSRRVGCTLRVGKISAVGIEISV